MGTKVIWDGKDLPPVGCKVLIKLASVKPMRPYEVVGYAVRPPPDEAVRKEQPRLCVVVILLKSRDGEGNERFLNEVFPLDHGVMYG